MIKLTYCLRRLPHLSREAFQDYWLNHHGPLVRAHATALRLKRYVQSHTLAEADQDPLRASRGGPVAFDGIAELWWNSREDFEASFTTPEGREAGRILLQDEQHFIDMKNSPIMLSHEKTLVQD